MRVAPPAPEDFAADGLATYTLQLPDEAGGGWALVNADGVVIEALYKPHVAELTAQDETVLAEFLRRRHKAGGPGIPLPPSLGRRASSALPRCDF